LKEAKKRLEGQIKALERELNDELPKAFAKALEHGDLRENAEYQTAKERQSYVQAHLGQLRERLSNLSMINLRKIPTDTASYGSTVVISDSESGEETTYSLVTPEESDVSRGLISTTSPIGKGLMGHEEGEEVEIRTPRGSKLYEIVKLITIHDKKED